MPKFNLTDFPEAATLPEWLTPSSTWVEHEPMVPILIKLLQPRTFVELGTFGGDSYMMFCQSVAMLGLSTKCTAVDTWAGDEHTGSYGPELYERLQKTHDPKYGSFSRLLRTDFDSAAGEFPEKSVDLLHIDGYHTYDAVKHDYDTWLPKMSDRGVILFHDTMVRTGDFGVWKLWAEISKGRPNINVPYGFGLGILAVGRSVPTRFLDFLAGIVSEHARIFPFFMALGHRIVMIRKSVALATAIHECQASANEWRTAHGDPIHNPTPNHAALHEDPRKFSESTLADVRELTAEALKLMGKT
ncbi:MAG TPA: class I SAM-dependent methyltransferase [Phycisphaerae bacterium]|nr:class I SAM-dependent methyltransferase [Phycisphaerae bacterium]